MFYCPGCGTRYEEGGECELDGTPLESLATPKPAKTKPATPKGKK